MLFKSSARRSLLLFFELAVSVSTSAVCGREALEKYGCLDIAISEIRYGELTERDRRKILKGS